MNEISSEQAPQYRAEKQISDDIISQAITELEARLRQPGPEIGEPRGAREYFFLTLAEKPSEAFCVAFLDNRHRAIECREMFQGTIDGASVHPREVVRAAIELNAAAVILAHNHPSGLPEPSRADITLTKRLTEALALIDVRVLDHFVIGNKCADSVSMAERGLI